MNRLFGIALLMAICLQGYAQLPHWQSLGITFDRPPLSFYVDSQENVMYIVGNFHKVNGIGAEIVKWDGKHFTLLPLAPYGLFGPVIKYQGSLYANGNKGICRFDGTSWQLTDTTVRRSAGCFYEYQGELWAPGDIEYKPSMGGDVCTIATWDGSSWTDHYRVDTLFGGKLWFITNMAVYQGELYFGGNINPAGKPAISEIMRFDGKHWKDVGGGIRNNGLGDVTQLLPWKGDLYASGMFEERDGAPGNSIARWDGRQWHRLAGGVTTHGGATMTQMTIFHDNLYVVGGFSKVDGMSTSSGIARWDGRSWCTLGDTAYGFMSINVFQEELYVGGEFQQINSDSSFVRLAKWTGGDYTESCIEPLKVPDLLSQGFTMSPNPVVEGRFTIAMDRIDRTGILVTVRDVSGRQVYSQRKKVADGHYSCEINLGDAPPGIYFVELWSGAKRIVGKVVLQ